MKTVWDKLNQAVDYGVYIQFPISRPPNLSDKAAALVWDPVREQIYDNCFEPVYQRIRNDSLSLERRPRRK